MTFEVFFGIECRADVLGGKPIITGTRVPAWQILHSLLWGETPAEIVAQYDSLGAEDVANVISFARLVLDGGMRYPALTLTSNERRKILSLLDAPSDAEALGTGFPNLNDDEALMRIVARFIAYFDKPWIPVRTPR